MRKSLLLLFLLLAFFNISLAQTTTITFDNQGYTHNAALGKSITIGNYVFECKMFNGTSGDTDIYYESSTAANGSGGSGLIYVGDQFSFDDPEVFIVKTVDGTEKDFEGFYAYEYTESGIDLTVEAYKNGVLQGTQTFATTIKATYNFNSTFDNVDEIRFRQKTPLEFDGYPGVVFAFDQFIISPAVGSNSSPTDIVLSASSVNENVTGNTTVGSLSTTDPNAGNTFTYTLVSGTGSTDNASFNISGSSLRITNSPDFESKNSYSVRIRTTDQGSATYEEAFTITINNVNETPTDIALSTSSVSENVAGNTTVGSLSTTDPDAGNTFTYTLVSGTGSTDNATFNISGSSLRITNSPDYETKNSYSVRIRTTDQGSLTYEEAFTITIDDVVEVAAATVTTASASAIATTSATLGGNVTADGGATVSERGVVYNTTGTPTTSDSKISTGTGTGTFSQSVTGLTASTTYYFRSYAINSAGTSYGITKSFNTRTSSTEAFSAATINDVSFLSNGNNFTLTGSYHIEEYSGFGHGGDAKYVGNSNNCLSSAGVIGSVKSTSGDVMIESLWVFPSNDCANLSTSGTAILRGKKLGSTLFTITVSSSELNGSMSSNQGFTFIDFANYPFANTSQIDQLEVEVTGSLRYLAIDDITYRAISSLPSVTSATYNANTGILAVTGTGFTNGGAIDVSKLTVTAESGSTYTLTSANVTASSTTGFSVTLNATDKAAVNQMINKNGTSSTGGTTYNLAAAANWDVTASSSADLTGNGITVSNVAVPAITSATYNANTGTLAVIGTGFLSASGATNDIIANKFTLTAEGGATYTLTDAANVEITSGTSFTLTLSATDKSAINQIINKNGTSSTGGTTYNLSAAEDWAAGADAAVSVVDATGNGITVSNVAVPAIVSAVYNANIGALVVTGTGFLSASGATNDIVANKFTITAEGGATYTLTDTGNGEITSATFFTLTLSAADKAAVNQMVNKNGTSSTAGTTYNLAAAEDWAAGADAAVVVADVTGNGITVSNVAAPAITSATYNANTGAIVVTGSAYKSQSGATNDIVANKFTLTGEGGSTYTLTDAANVDITSGTSFTLTLSATDKAGVNQILNKNGTSSTGGTTYNLAAAEDWAAGADAAVVVADLTGNGITVSNVAVPVITSATYDASTGALAVIGNGFLKLAGSANDIVANKFTLTGEGGTTYTLTDTGNGEITVGTSFTLTLSATDKAAVSLILNKNGTSSIDATTYNIAATEDWAAGANAAVAVADLAGNGITVSNVDNVSPAIASVSVPANATYVSGQNLDFSINFDENTTVNTGGGTPRLALTLNTGGTVYANYISGSGTSVLVFRYTVASGNEDADGITVSTLSTNGGTLKDVVGNDATLTLNSVGSTANVLVDAISPTVSSVSVPANGTYGSAQNLDFTANFSENVTVNTGGGTPYIGLTLNTGGAVQAAYVSGSGTSALTFRYTIASGNADADGVTLASSITANGATLRDATGNNATLTLNSVGSTASVLVDGAAPTVSSINRLSASPTNSTSLDYTLTFSESVTGVDASDFTLTTTGTATGSVSGISGSGSFYTVTVNAISGDGTLRLDLKSSGTGITDGAGNAISAGYTSGHAYTIDNAAPVVTSVNVPANDTYGSGQNLDFTVNFNDNVTVNITGGTPNVAVTLNTGGPLDAGYISGSGTSSLVFRYTVQAGDLDADGVTVGTLSSNNGTLQDAVGNNATLTLNGVGSTAGVLVDATFPTLTAVTVASNNAASALAKTGNVVTLSLTASETINTPTVTIAGHSASVSGLGTTYTATYTMSNTDTEGTIPFSIAFADAAGNTGTTVTATTNSSSVTFDRTAPAIPTGLAATAGDTQNSLSWTGNTETDLASYKIYGGTTANPTSLLQTANASAVNYTHTSLTNGTAYYYRISAVDNAGNESTATADAGATPKAPQTITFNALATKTYGDADFDPAATASSNLTVAYTSSNTAVATIVSGKVHVTGAGTTTITAAQAGNGSYLPATSVDQQLTVNKKDITLSLNASPSITKVYNGNTSATLATGNYTLTGIETGDVVTVSGTASYNTKNAGTGKIVTANNFVLAGAQKNNYNLTTTGETTTGAINKKDITLTLNASPAITKVYDGSTSATLAAANYSLQGVESSDVLGVSGVASYDTKDAGSNKTITVTNFELSGTDKDNYNLTTTSETTTGNITKKDVTLALNATPTITKVYDGNTSATLAAGNYSLSGIETNDVVSVTGTATYADKDAGSGKNISINGFVLAGAQKDNYNLTTAGANTTGNITKKDITVTLNSTPAITKVYDGGTGATLVPANYTLHGIETNDIVKVSGAAAYDTKIAGTGKTVTLTNFVLNGDQKDNYKLTTATAATTGSISKAVLMATADNKEKFLGTANPAFTVTYTDFIGGDTKSDITTPAVASTTANLNSPTGTYPITANGAVADNYNFTYVSGTLTVKPGAPTNVVLAGETVFENAPAGTLAGTLSSQSDDPGATFTYALVAGSGDDNNALFVMADNKLKTNASLNYEGKKAYKVRVKSTTQYGFSLEKVFVLNISDVNEIPTIAAIADQTLCYTPAVQKITLNGISAGEDAGQDVTVKVETDKLEMFKELSVAGNELKCKLAPGASGTATLTITVKDNGGTENGGVDETSQTFTVTVNALPEIKIASDTEGELSKGLEARLTATGGVNYEWADAEGIVGAKNSDVLTVRPSKTTTYRVKVTNASGCAEEKEITVAVKENFLVMDANNFMSPDGDGVNDNLVIKNIDMYPNNELKIYDRAGRLLFSKKNYKDEWDGTFNGIPLEEDTYYYIVDFGPGKMKIKGFVTLVRQ